MLILDSPDHGYNPAAEAFKNFDQDQTGNMLGSLHLDTDDEPRRGASRANSVRFDESALHGTFGHGSRSSTDFLPMRTGSAFGSHPMTERSLSHKSDGRQSSAGQSTHSARASSFGFEQRPLSATVPPFVPSGPPPGLFILGPVPSIIRCWLDTRFTNESLLYASVCTGSYKSIIDSGLVSRLGYQDQITTAGEGVRLVKITVFLPEATIQQSSSRSSSPAPQLPTLTIDFVVQDLRCQVDSIQIFIGCDALRTRNADIHFSLDRLTLFDDERNKLSVPLVRPENATMYQNLQTTVMTNSTSAVSKLEQSSKKPEIAVGDGKTKESAIESVVGKSDTPMPTSTPSSPSVIGEGRKAATDQKVIERPPSALKANVDLKDSESVMSSTNETMPDTPTRAESSNIWGSWRRDSAQGSRPEALSSSASTTSGYQRAGRGRGMKILKPARLNTARAASGQQQPVGFDAVPSRFGETSKASSQVGPFENNEHPSAATERRSVSSEIKQPHPSLTNKTRAPNPIGGASAFGWLNSTQPKQPTSTTE